MAIKVRKYNSRTVTKSLAGNTKTFCVKHVAMAINCGVRCAFHTRALCGVWCQIVFPSSLVLLLLSPLSDSALLLCQYILGSMRQTSRPLHTHTAPLAVGNTGNDINKTFCPRLRTAHAFRLIK